MERLLQDALNIQKLIPWIESDEDIINFMRRIPIEKNYLKNKLTLLHFLKEKDNVNGEDFDQGIEDDAREIVVSFPDLPYKEIKRRLRVFGTMINRKEAVLRELLGENLELDKLLHDLDHQPVRKRSINGDSTPDIKIKIRKIDGTLEVVSPINQKFLKEPLGNTAVQSKHTEIQQHPQKDYEQSNNSANNVCEQLPETIVISTPSTSYSAGPSNSCKGFNNASTSSAPCTIVSSQVHNLQPSPLDMLLTAAYQDSPDSNYHPKPKIAVKDINLLTSKYPNEASKLPVKDVNNFNLVQYVNEITQASVDEIEKVCKKLRMDNCLRPNDKALNALINHFIKSQNKKMEPSIQISSGSEDSPILVKPILQMPITFRTPSRMYDTSDSDGDEGGMIQQKFNSTPVDLSKSNSPDSSKNTFIATSFPQPCSSKTVSPVQTQLGNKNVLQVENKLEKTSKKNLAVNEQLVLKLIELFPQACPDYLRNLCAGKQWNSLDEIIEIIISDPNHPQRPEKPPSPPKEIDPEDQYEVVKALLPDADPTYLRMQCETLEYDPTKLNEFINQANENKDYPTMKEYLRKQQLSAQSKQYTEEFNVEKFVELFPEPEKTFNDPDRRTGMDKWSRHYLQHYFEKRYDRIHKRTITGCLLENEYKVMATDRALMYILQTTQLMKSRRKPLSAIEYPQNILILQELAYLEHKNEIEKFIEEKKKQEDEDRQYAKDHGLLNTCECCYDEEVMLKDRFLCPKEHMFCRSCIKRSCEIALGDGKTDFKCLSDCDEEFQLQTLQQALPPKMFSRLAQKKALAEIKAAGLEELESCPFCDFATIPNENDKIFRCLNPDCMKESCRKCNEPNHIPLNCDEIEKDEEVQARTYIENKMTEALLRQCYKCGTSFFKEEGCNKMTCTCGASMCYVCKQPVKDYTHFNGIGGDKFHLCPLYSDTNQLNQQNVLGAAATAKAEVDTTKLKVDPTTDVVQHYEQRKKNLPHEPHLDLVHQPPFVHFGGLAVAIRQQQRHRHHHRENHPYHHI